MRYHNIFLKTILITISIDNFIYNFTQWWTAIVKMMKENMVFSLELVIWSKTNQNNSIIIMKVLVIQSCLTLCDPMNCSPPGSSVHGILQVRILERVAIPFSRGSSQPRDGTQVSRIAGIFFTIWATREAP